MRTIDGNNIFGEIAQPPYRLDTESEGNPKKQEELRDWIDSLSDEFRGMASEIQESVHRTHSSPVLIRQTGIESISKESRAAIMLGFTALLGKPTTTDKKYRRVVWPISVPRNANAGNSPTFSEHNHEAGMHTDSQYLESPEQAICLWAIQPDKYGEGLSSSVSAEDLMHEMTSTADGRESLQALQQENIPFRVPRAFTQNPDSDAVEVIYGKIFGDTPTIRYREDTIQMGYDATGKTMPPEIKKALADMTAAMIKVRSNFFLLEAGDVLWINNHDHLHARTKFSDLERLLFRIRYNFI